MLAQIWGCTRDESNHIVHEFFKSHHFAVGVLPMPGKPDKIGHPDRSVVYCK